MAVALDGNNPGGMKDGPWARRQPGYAGSNGAYAKFTNLTYGLAAMTRLLDRSYIDMGYDTANEIAHRWAPHGEGNRPDLYALKIAQGLGIRLSDPIKDSQARELALVMAKIENKDFPAKWAKEQADA